MPSPVAELLGDLSRELERLDLRWYLFGAQAALLHGAARLTADVDVTVDVGGTEPMTLCRALTNAGFEPRSQDIAAFVARTRVLPLVHQASGLPLDVVIAGTSLERRFMTRATVRSVEGVSVPVARPEDLVAMKVLAGRAKDLDDAAAVVAANPDLDSALVTTTLRELDAALDRHDLLPTFESLLVRTRRAD
jgi:hypothetical protein